MCAEDTVTHEERAASQKSHMDQQMSTALHGIILSNIMYVICTMKHVSIKDFLLSPATGCIIYVAGLNRPCCVEFSATGHRPLFLAVKLNKMSITTAFAIYSIYAERPHV